MSRHSHSVQVEEQALTRVQRGMQGGYRSVVTWGLRAAPPRSRYAASSELINIFGTVTP